MQKVVGSNPISRSHMGPRAGAALLLGAGALLTAASLLGTAGAGGTEVFGWKQAVVLAMGVLLGWAGLGLALWPSGVLEGEERVGSSFLRLLGLSAMAIAGPLFALLRDNAEFFATRGSHTVDVVVFALATVLLPPLVLLAGELAAGLAGAGPRRLFHLSALAGLAGLVALRAVRGLDSLPAELLLALAFSAGALAAAAVARLALVRAFSSALAVAAPLFLALFLLSPGITPFFESEDGTAPAREARPVPVVMVLFDEFALTALLERPDRIDARRYPNFARLAREATWYSRASTPSSLTTEAVPAVLTGNRPREGLLPRASDHPQNLFTLLAPSHELRVEENVSSLCPIRLCPAREAFTERMSSMASDLGVVFRHLALPAEPRLSLPRVYGRWERFAEADARSGRDEELRFDRFLAGIEGGGASAHFVHLTIPHRPWNHLPSGRRYMNGGWPRGATTEGHWEGAPYEADQAYQRYLLEVGYADHLLGRLIARLRATGIYDEAAVVIAADHGISIRTGEWARDPRTPDAYGDVLGVPLFVKAPGQTSGRTVRRNVETVDLLPGLARMLGMRLGRPVDGRPLDDPALDRARIRFHATRGDAVLPIRSTDLDRARRAALARKRDLFGTGGSRPGLFGIGPHPGLVGRPLRGLRVSDRPALSARIDQAKALAAVDPATGELPTYLTGELHGLPAGSPVDVALAVNGRIVAVGRSDRGEGDSATFAIMMPERALRPGRNDVRMLVVLPGPRLLG